MAKASAVPRPIKRSEYKILFADASAGYVNEVVQIGQTVRRSAGPWTPTIHALLAWIRVQGVNQIPIPLGIDAEGREIMSYLPGHTGEGENGAWVWDEAVLSQAGVLLRAIHDASTNFPRSGMTWRLPAHYPDEVICLNDVAPYNMIGGFDVTGRAQLTGFIDVDMASPGPRIHDLAYLAYRLCPFIEDEQTTVNSLDLDPLKRLKKLVTAYGTDTGITTSTLLAAIPARIMELANWSEKHAATTGNLTLLSHAQMYRRDADRISGTGVRSDQ